MNEYRTDGSKSNNNNNSGFDSSLCATQRTALAKRVESLDEEDLSSFAPSLKRAAVLATGLVS